MNVKLAIIAASVAATTLPAQTAPIAVTGATNISISGLLSVGVKNSSISQGNAAVGRNTATETHVDDNTSRLIVASNSKIADGWNVLFRLESRFTPNVRPGDALLQPLGGPPAGYSVGDATGWADGDTFGGVSSPYGTITVGKSTLYYTDTISAGYLAPVLEQPGESYRIWDANGLSAFNILSTYNTGTVTNGTLAPVTRNILGNTRSRNVVRYDSVYFKPDAVSILNFSLAWSKNAAGAQNVFVSNANGSTYEGGQTVYAKALYNGHGFSASASYLDQKFQGVLASAPLTELKATRLGVSYKTQGFKFGVIYDSTNMVNGITTGTVLSDATRTAFSVPVSYSFGDHGFYATYSAAGKTASLDKTGAKQFNLVYDYAMTKRAFIGVYFTKIDNDANAYYQPFLTGYSPFGGSAIAKGESWRQVGIIMNYWF